MTSYHIYANNGLGGPVNYTTPIGTTALLTFSPPAVAVSSDTTWALRAFDTVTGLEEQNVDVRVRLVVDASGNDISDLPGAPTGLTVTALAGGSVLVSWFYSLGAALGVPQSFKVYAGSPTVNYAAAAAGPVAYRDGPLVHFSATVSGLTLGSTYQFAVRSSNAAGEEKNTTTVSLTIAAVGPLPPDNLTATAV